MSTVLTEIDQALAGYTASHRSRPVAVYLGERKFTQLILDIASSAPPLPDLSTDHGRPLTYRSLDLLRDDVNVDALRVI